MKEERTLNVIFGKGGSGSTTTRLTLPIKWVKELGIDIEHKEVVATLEDDKIIIKKKWIIPTLWVGRYTSNII